MRFLARVHLIALLGILISTHAVNASGNDSEDSELSDSHKLFAKTQAKKYYNATSYFFDNSCPKKANYTIQDQDYPSFKSCQMNTLLKIIDVCHMMRPISDWNTLDTSPQNAIAKFGVELQNEVCKNLYHDYFKPLTHQCYVNIYGQRIPLFTCDNGFFFLILLSQFKFDISFPESAYHSSFICEALEEHLTFLYTQLQGRFISKKLMF